MRKATFLSVAGIIALGLAAPAWRNRQAVIPGSRRKPMARPIPAIPTG